ncbi:MAG TPA: hypothetical protein VFO05_12675 [Candidatus Limnocylindrales bacterium]|nr:hypothetical protein [Candidatus Limnocylindrales bacterium]
MAVGSVLAVHDQDFELDGNAFDSPAGVPDDWSNVFNNTDSAVVSTFVDDPLDADEDDIFTTGGSKDDLDIAAGGVPGANVGPWMWTTGSVPDKDNIEDAFAAAYNCDDFPSGGGFGDPDSDPDLCLYFGLDRFANNGDAQVGFWFFQSEHAKNPDGTFSNAHDVGDILVLSDFTNGGVVSTIRVFRWVGTGGDTNDTLENVFNGVACSTTTAPDVACAQANTVDIPSPWPYTPKSGDANVFPQGSFFEGGVNLSALGLDIGCGAGFLAETRSSQSVDATLKDFALGSFSLCGLEVTKEGDELSKVGDGANYTFTIENTGSVTLFRESIIDDVIGDITDNVGLPGTVSNYVSNCGASLAAAASCTITLTYTIQAGDDDPLINTVTATYNSASDFSGSDVADTDDHSTNLFQPSVEITKGGDSLSKVGDDVTYTFEIENTSSADSPDLIIDSISDTLLGDLAAEATAADCDTLAPGDSCSFNVVRTVLAGDADPLPNTVTVHYHPENFPNDITDSDDHEVNLFQPSFTVDKTGDELSKATDTVNYTITIDNTSSSDSPALICDVVDSLLGTLATDVSIAANAANVVYTPSRVVLVTDPDPLVNTVTVTCSPDGFPNVIEHTDSHTTNLFQPSIEVTKTADALSKVGDDVHYVITIENTSSADSPNLVFETINDTLEGNLLAECPASLASGATCTIEYDRTVQPGDPDPLENTVTVQTHPDGFPNDIDGSATASTNLFQPSVDVEKVCEDFSKAGDVLDCTITITNTSSTDSPDLENGTIDDTLIGDLLDPLNTNVASNDCTDSLAVGDSCTITTTYTVTVNDPDPLINTVEVHYNPDGFPNDITDEDSESVDIVHPSFTITKDCLTQTVPAGGSAIFEIVVTNTGDVALNFVLDEEANWFDIPGDAFPGAPANLSVGGGETHFTLAAGEHQHFDVTLVAGSGPIVENEVNATATLPASFGLDNVLTDSANDSCDVAGGATRTPGFWQTHVSYTTHVFEDHLGGTIDLGWKILDDPSEVFGMFWANNAKESDGSRRSKVCQAQVQGSFQLLAAILNTGLDNGAAVPIDPVTGDDLITAMRDALAAGNRQEILRLAALLDAYNNSGDDIAIIDNDGFLVGKADPKLAKQIADLTIADCN